MIKYVSFDLDGTLADETFDHLMWNVEMPNLYAQTHNIDVKRAEEIVFAEYYKALYIEKIENWVEVDYWFKRLKINDWQSMINNLKKHVSVYDDTFEILDYLKTKYKLIIVSSSNEQFIDIKLKSQGLAPYFENVFSSSSMYGKNKKDRSVFEDVLNQLKIKPSEMVHIGDSPFHDHSEPSTLGITSYLIDRTKKKKGDYVIYSLRELKEVL
ncbi:HAD family hydrolase [Candidatus Micrarchaeota archaeon]|nr:HAD family hydrolase [Candidatus Micrarchaeota archaeon]